MTGDWQRAQRIGQHLFLFDGTILHARWQGAVEQHDLALACALIVRLR